MPRLPSSGCKGSSQKDLSSFFHSVVQHSISYGPTPSDIETVLVPEKNEQGLFGSAFYQKPAVQCSPKSLQKSVVIFRRRNPLLGIKTVEQHFVVGRSRS